MKLKQTFSAVVLGLAAMNIQAAEFVLTDSTKGTDVGDWQVSNSSLGLKSDDHFSVEKRRLHGGKQLGVDVIIVNNGELTVTLVPTRGMGILHVERDGERILGWDSPVKEVVNPMFIDLESRNGLGWLDGFNEMLVRCGYEWTGHPGVDENGQLLSLHGRVQNTPASNVKVTIDDIPPHKITIEGDVSERTFKKAELTTRTKLEIIPGENSFSLHDTLTNHASYDDEYQIIYHSNFGRPILEEGAKVTAAASEVSPFNDYAQAGLESWQTYLGPTKDFDEMVFNLKPIGDEKGNSLVVLHNRSANKGVAVGYNVKQLPVLTLWKNTDTEKQGYVTGIEPGTSYAYNTKFQRPLGLVPTIKAGESKHFDVTYTVLRNEGDVSQALKQVDTLQKGKPVKQSKKLIVDLNKVQ
ncbi:aldose 1-epimerase family protein [Vibrio casei]|uniref:DUF4432 family protein n=1 Tax=Vibrio casei TaxID=673372 RepID=A0A368LGG4_9VIBR|nr:aldose 1-epimerase family protein [Vibrio casei]RCS69122.1 DUF4432 family protein [Vibrio casei]SJN37271.1 hypothetical protein FM109_14650 [Vibrio casei]